tara:strand:+ start:934 stop:1098 length:165 start_codon:yes stop_codon:yes gene_type:complete
MDVKKEKRMKDIHLKQILTIGGVVAVSIATSYIIRSYLDVLRIEKLKKELKQSE